VINIAELYWEIMAVPVSPYLCMGWGRCGGRSWWGTCL